MPKTIRTLAVVALLTAGTASVARAATGQVSDGHSRPAAAASTSNLTPTCAVCWIGG